MITLIGKTHDANTLPDFAGQRIAHGQTMSGLIIVHDNLPLGGASEELLLIAEATNVEEWVDGIVYLPLR